MKTKELVTMALFAAIGARFIPLFRPFRRHETRYDADHDVHGHPAVPAGAKRTRHRDCDWNHLRAYNSIPSRTDS